MKSSANVYASVVHIPSSSVKLVSRLFPFPLVGWRCLAQPRMGTGQSRPREAAQPPAASRVQQLQLIRAQPESEQDMNLS